MKSACGAIATHRPNMDPPTRLSQKKLQHIYRSLHKKLQANKKKSKEIVQFIRVYIRNSEEFT